MSRWVVGEQTGLMAEAAGSEKADDAIGRITKYVPAEILSAYTVLFTFLASIGASRNENESQIPSTNELTEIGTNAIATFGLIALFFVITIIYINMRAGTGHVKKAHLIVSPIAFLAWSYPISSSMLGIFFNPYIAFAGMALVIGLSIFIKPVE